MKTTKKPLAILSAFLMISQTGFAQMKGNRPNLGGIAQQRPNVDDNEQAVPREHCREHEGTHEQLVQTCNKGWDVAMTMARHHIRSYGNIVGCLDGYNNGKAEGIDEEMRRHNLYIAEYRSRYMNPSTIPGNPYQVGYDQGLNEPTSAADSIVINRHRGVVDTGAEPNSSIEMRLPSFNTTQFDTVYFDVQRPYVEETLKREGFIDSNPSTDELREAHFYYQAAADMDRYGIRGLCPDRSGFHRDIEIYKWGRRKYYSRRHLDLSPYEVKDPWMSDLVRASWDNFINEAEFAVPGFSWEWQHPRIREDYRKLRRLRRDYREDLSRNFQYQVEEEYTDPADGVKKKRMVTKTANLKDIFYKSFTHTLRKNGYRRTRRNYELGVWQGYNRMAERGYRQGRDIGFHIAQDKAHEIAFNERFKDVATDGFNEGYEESYSNAWSRAWSYFQSNPIFEMKEFSLEDEIDDGIFRKDERVRAHYSAQNIGRVQGSASFSIAGNQLTSTNASGLSIPASSSREGSTTYIMQINENAEPKSTASATMTVRGGGSSYSSALNKSDSFSVYIETDAMVDERNLDNDLNYVRGKGEIKFDFYNPTTSVVPLATANLYIEGIDAAFGASVVSIPANDGRRSAVIRYSGLDPLELIQDTRVLKMNLETAAGGVPQESIELSARVRDGEKRALAEYFHDLVQNPTEAVGSQGKDVATTTMMMIDKAYQMTDSEMVAKTDWKSESQVNSTLIGNMRSVYQREKAKGAISETAQQYYVMLTNRLNELFPCAEKYDVGCGTGKLTKRYQEVLASFNDQIEPKKQKK